MKGKMASYLPQAKRQWVTALLLSVGACASAPDTSTSPRTEATLTVLTWWNEKGEKNAKDALFRAFKEKEPGVTVNTDAFKTSQGMRSKLKSEMEKSTPPDTFQAISGEDLLGWAASDRMVPLDGLALENDWDGAFHAVVLKSLRLNNALYGVPINIERDNNIYYNIRVFQEAQLAPPHTLADFYTACDVLNRPDSPGSLAMPASGWVLAMVLFESLMPALHGGEFYSDFFSGKVNTTDPRLRTLFEEFKRVLACSNLSKDSTAEWSSFADQLRSGTASMFIMGDWANGYFAEPAELPDGTQSKWQPGVDYDVTTALGSKGYFVFNAAVFGLPQGAQHPVAAKSFLSLVGSREGQRVFNLKKGSLPARTDVDLTDFDALTQRAARDFDAASKSGTLLPGYASLSPFNYQSKINPSLLVFALGGQRAYELKSEEVQESESKILAGDVDYILAKLAANYSILQKSGE